MYNSEIREFDLKLSGKPGKYQGTSFHELAGNPVSDPVTLQEIHKKNLPSFLVGTWKFRDRSQA